MDIILISSYLRLLILVGIFLTSGYANYCAYSNCTESRLKPGPLSTPGPRVITDFDRNEKLYTFDCCGEGFTSITWSRLISENEIPYPWERGLDSPVLCHSDQTLVFGGLKATDTGVYICQLSNGTASVSRKLVLYVDSSEHPTSRVIPSMYRQGNVTAAIGNVVTLPCSGYFGFGDPFLQSLDWYYAERGSTELMRFDDNSTHYRKISVSGDGGLTGINLEIHVSEEDFNLAFQCMMSTAILNDSHTYTAYLVRKESKITWSPLIHVLVAVVVTIIVCLFLFGAYYRKRHCVRYHWAKQLGRLVSRDDCKYDVFLLSQEFNMEFVHANLHQQLLSLGYNVCEYHTDILGNRQELEAQTMAMNESACTIMVYSCGDLDDHGFDTLLSIARTNVISIVIVQVDSSAELKAKIDQLKQDEQQELRQAKQLFHIVIWPGDGSDRALQSFWYQLRRHLPKPGSCKVSKNQTRERLKSAEEPLISQHTDNNNQSVAVDIPNGVFFEDILRPQVSRDSGYGVSP